MCNEIKAAVAPATLTVEALAAALCRGAHATTREWAEVPRDSMTYRVYTDLARHMLERYVVLPLENTHACSGCRTLTDALNNLDEARREVVSYQQKSDGLLERIDMMQRVMCSTEDSEGTPV